MSFAVIQAGDTAVVAERVAAIKMHDALGELTQRFVADALALQTAAGVIVELAGHSDQHQANVSINIRPVHPVT